MAEKKNAPQTAKPLHEDHRARMRVRVEHIFARLAHMGADWCRSIGLKRATQHNHLGNLVYNMDRYACLIG